MSKMQASDNSSKVYRVIARQSTGIITEGVTYEVLQCEQYEDMWCIVGDQSCRAWLKHRFSEPLPEKHHVEVIEDEGCLLTIGKFYEIIRESARKTAWVILDDRGDTDCYCKSRFKEPITELLKESPKQLENVFIRVNGEAEKEAAIELLKEMGYKPPTGLNSGSTILGFVGYNDGDLTTLLTPFWSSRVHKELKVNKQIIPAKVVFTLSKEKTYNVDGKELTRVEVEGIIAEMDKNIVEIGFKSNLLYRLLQGE
jgi:hypothetical protein